ncbi:MAG: sel1 repeat family protein, partial [Rhizobiales bacterium]|nr:sel1 repeat family protein [Hyphomicrobiales bacterium]
MGGPRLPSPEDAALAPDSAPPPSSGGPPPDLAYGAFQRGFYLTAFSLAIPRAEKGDAAAQTLIALMYEAGYGVPRDYGKAAEWYGLAAKAGDREAQYSLGMMLASGTGIAKDPKRALELFEASAAKGQLDAGYQLALLGA